MMGQGEVGGWVACDGTTALLRHGHIRQVYFEEQGEAVACPGRVHGCAVGVVETHLEDRATTELGVGMGWDGG